MNWKEFPYSRSLDFKNGGYVYTPSLEIEIINGSRKFSTDAIIDSGSDCTMMSGEVAQVLGIDFSKCEKDPDIKGILGASSEGFIANIKIKVEKFEDEPLDVKVTFIPGLNTPVLLGQNDFFQHFQVLFNKKKNIFKLSSD